MSTSSLSANMRAATEWSEILCRLQNSSTTPTSTELLAEAAMKLPGFYADTVDFVDQFGELKGATFAAYMAHLNATWEGVKVIKGVQDKIEPAPGTAGASIRISSSVTMAMLDVYGDEVSSTRYVNRIVQTLTYNDQGKIVKQVNKYDKAAIDRLREKQSQANKKINEDNMAVWSKNLQAWGSGQYSASNPDRRAVAAQYWSEDVHVDARFPMDHTDAFSKAYTGFDGCFEYIDFMDSQMEVTDFAMPHCAPLPNGEIITVGSFRPKVGGKVTDGKVEQVQRVSIKGGKVRRIISFWGPGMTECDAVFNPDPKAAVPKAPNGVEAPKADGKFSDSMAAWGAVMAAWGSGRFDAEEHATADCVIDARYPLKNDPDQGFKVYRGREGVRQWMKYLSNWDMTQFRVDLACEGPDGSILALMSNVPKFNATGKTTAGRVDFIQRIVMKDGKLAHVTFFQGPGGVEYDALFVEPKKTQEEKAARECKKPASALGCVASRAASLLGFAAAAAVAVAAHPFLAKAVSAA